jgi:hypothetical protein
MTTETGRVPDLAEVADRLAMHDVLAKHSRGVDRADEAILKSAYWPHATVEYGGFQGSAHEFCAILPAAISQHARTQHSVTNVAIEQDGDEARVESYVTAYHYTANDDGPDTEMTYLGRYLDTMQKRQDVWKISHRRIVMDWNQNVAATAVWEGPTFDGIARGGRVPKDPLYTFLG